MAEKKSPSCMCPLCGTVSGLLVLVAGVVFLMASLVMLDSATSGLVGGTALALYGLSILVHSANMCPVCR